MLIEVICASVNRVSEADLLESHYATQELISRKLVSMIRS